MELPAPVGHKNVSTDDTFPKKINWILDKKYNLSSINRNQYETFPSKHCISPTVSVRRQLSFVLQKFLQKT